MNSTNWKPFVMVGLMIAMMFCIGLGFLTMIFSRTGPVGPETTQGVWWPGMWGMGPFMMIFPCFGLVMMLFMMFFFFQMLTGGAGPMSGMMGRGGPMSGMMGHSHDLQSQSQVPSAESQDTCPSCDSPIQADWKVCPHCGQELANKNI